MFLNVSFVTYIARSVGDPNFIAQMRSKIRRLPAIHRETLRAIVEHLARVAANSEKNKMDVRNLAIVFGTVIFGEEDIPKAGDLLSVQSIKVLDLSPPRKKLTLCAKRTRGWMT